MATTCLALYLLSQAPQVDLIAPTFRPNATIGATAVATVLAFVVGFASIAVLLRYLATHTVYVFIAIAGIGGALSGLAK